MNEIYITLYLIKVFVLSCVLLCTICIGAAATVRQSSLDTSKQWIGAPRRSVFITIKNSTFYCIYFP